MEPIIVKQNSTSAATIEDGLGSSAYTLTWEDLTYTVYDKKTKQEKDIVKKLCGSLPPGSICAVLGASGSGKTSFLDAIAGRKKDSQVKGSVYINGSTDFSMKHVSKYCTQEDALFGNLTVEETLLYAARFNLPQSCSEEYRKKVVDELLLEFGLNDVRKVIIGTPLMKGISGGQKRRVSVATQLVGWTGGVLFLDEPTSGLDSVAAYSVIDSVKRLAVNKNCTVMATIHQPSTETFNIFTHLLIIGKGQTVYFGKREEALSYFESIGSPIPAHSNPSDVYLQLTNTDFQADKTEGELKVAGLIQSFQESPNALALAEEIAGVKKNKLVVSGRGSYHNSLIHQTSVLMSRGFLNAFKNPLSYWVRVAMYTALALLMGTFWLRLGFEQSHVINRMVSINFSVAFLSFMAVAGIPAFLEERHVFLRERANGLYGVESYLLSNFLVSMPFLLIVAVAFSVVGYNMMGLQATADRFFIYLGYMFVMLLIAEAQVILVGVIIPIFVAALTIVAFANGLWMVVDGFALVRTSDIPAGWRYTFHYIDYQKYTFEGLLKNEMTGLTFQCASSPQSVNGCACLVPGSLPIPCQFSGEDVLSYYEHTDVSYGQWLAILVGILVAFKLATYAVLKLKGTRT